MASTIVLKRKLLAEAEGIKSKRQRTEQSLTNDLVNVDPDSELDDPERYNDPANRQARAEQSEEKRKKMALVVKEEKKDRFEFKDKVTIPTPSPDSADLVMKFVPKGLTPGKIQHHYENKLGKGSIVKIQMPDYNNNPNVVRTENVAVITFANSDLAFKAGNMHMVKFDGRTVEAQPNIPERLERVAKRDPTRILILNRCPDKLTEAAIRKYYDQKIAPRCIKRFEWRVGKTGKFDHTVCIHFRDLKFCKAAESLPPPERGIQIKNFVRFNASCEVEIRKRAPQLTETMIRNHFAHFGPGGIVSISIPKQKHECGRVLFSKPEYAQQAVEAPPIKCYGHRGPLCYFRWVRQPQTHRFQIKPFTRNVQQRKPFRRKDSRGRWQVLLPRSNATRKRLLWDKITKLRRRERKERKEGKQAAAAAKPPPLRIKNRS